jgi:ubiquinone/menaquinone biosynthesis C-methylase UbiE
MIGEADKDHNHRGRPAYGLAAAGGKVVEGTQLIEDLRACLDAHILLDPPLAHSAFRHRPEMWTLAEELAAALYERYVHLDVISLTFGDFPFSPRLMRYALQDAILSTASYLAYREAADSAVTLALVRQAADRLRSFIAERGVDTLYRVYFVTMGNDFLQPFQQYKDVTEAEVLQGLRHHPIPVDRLDHMLMVALAIQMVRLKRRGTTRFVQLTKLGATHLRWIREIHAASGYDALRTAMSMIHQLDEVHDWEYVCEVVFPGGVALRGAFVEWAGLAGASHVLELSCGSGALTFDRKFIAALGAHGRLSTVDVAAVMPSLASHPLYQEGRMELRQASPDRLPYADRVFDACVGSVFLTHIDVRRALAEMRRTVLPGGTVALLYALRFDYAKPFIRDWFEPLFRLARVRSSIRHNSARAASVNEVTSWFAEADLHHIEWREQTLEWQIDHPEFLIEYLIRGVRWFQRLLMSLPWDDRRSMVLELIERGRDICRHWPPADRVLTIPMVMVKGRRPLGA